MAVITDENIYFLRINNTYFYFSPFLRYIYIYIYTYIYINKVYIVKKANIFVFFNLQVVCFNFKDLIDNDKSNEGKTTAS